jgi:hypothetical protein
MSKSPFFIALSIFGLLAAAPVVAQNSSIVDPGVSTHNYKHPNKATKARQTESQVRVPSINTVERYGKMRQNGRTSNTPKYAPRPATLVVVKTSQQEETHLNSLTSTRNYKTSQSHGKGQNTALANSYEVSKDSIYPNQD